MAQNQYSFKAGFVNKMLNRLDKFTLSHRVYRNPLLHSHLFIMKLYGAISFDDQRKIWLHNVRGIFFTVTFILFNMSEVSIYI